MKIPAHVKHDMTYFKFENHLYCRNCKQNASHFAYIDVVNDKTHFIINCSNCGEDGEYVMVYEKLREIYYTKDRLSGDLETLWRCFRLGLFYDQVFKTELEKKRYVKLVCRLNKDSSGLKKFWYGMKYAA